jgi:hypothetical protein
MEGWSHRGLSEAGLGTISDGERDPDTYPLRNATSLHPGPLTTSIGIYYELGEPGN